MLCEAAAAAAALFAVEEGWAVPVREAAEEGDAAVAAAVALVAWVWLVVAPPWGETTTDTRHRDRPSWTVTLILRADIVVPKVAAFPPGPATAASCAAFWSHCCPSAAYWPVPFRKSLTCWRWMSVYWPAAAMTSALAPLALGCGKLKSEKSSTNLQ